MNEAYACMMHHPAGFQISMVIMFLALIGLLSFVAVFITAVTAPFTKPQMDVPRVSFIPEFDDGKS